MIYRQWQFNTQRRFSIEPLRKCLRINLPIRFLALASNLMSNNWVLLCKQIQWTFFINIRIKLPLTEYVSSKTTTRIITSKPSRNTLQKTFFRIGRLKPTNQLRTGPFWRKFRLLLIKWLTRWNPLLAKEKFPLFRLKIGSGPSSKPRNIISCYIKLLDYKTMK